MRLNVVLARTYPSRIAAIETIRAQPQYGGGDELRAQAEAVSTAADLYGKADAARDWRSFATTLEILGLLADWNAAVHNATLD